MKGFGGFLFFIVITVVIAVLVCVISLWTQTNLNFWLSYLKGTSVHVPYWLAFLITIVGNGVILVVNIIAEIAKFAL